MRGRDWLRFHAATPEDVAAAAPWQSVPVPDVEPLVVNLGGATVRLSGAELARYAGLDDTAPLKGWPEPGQLSGAVVLIDVQASALDLTWPDAISRLYSHQLQSLAFHAGAELELWAVRAGTLRLWPCIAGPSTSQALKHYEARRAGT